MNITIDPSGRGFARYYERRSETFRLTPGTATGIGAVIGLHLLAGYLIAHSYFAIQPSPATADAPPSTIVDIFRPPPEKPLPKPTVAPPPTQEPPQTLTQREVAPEAQPAPVDVGVGIAPPGPVAEATAVLPPVATPAPPAPVPVPAPPRLITNPTWISKPTAEQMAGLYPERALYSGLSGRAVLICEILVSGSMGTCQVTEETSRGFKFGEAALAVSRYFRMNPAAINGVPVVGSKVRIPITFVPG